MKDKLGVRRTYFLSHSKLEFINSGTMCSFLSSSTFIVHWFCSSMAIETFPALGLVWDLRGFSG